MKCILHIGTHKTGSSSIQQMLMRNKAELLQNKVLYPGKRLSHFDLFTAFCAKPLDYHMVKQRGISTDQDVQVLIADYLRELDAEITDSTAERVILSAEDLCALKDEGLGNFAEYLSKMFESVTVVIYLRHPVSFGFSQFQQKVKGGESMFRGWQKYVWRYKPSLFVYEKHFGRENMRVRVFDRSKLHQGCVVHDFCREMDVSISDMTVPSINQAMSYEATMLLMSLNRYIPRFIDNKPNPLRDGVRGMLQNATANGKYQMSRGSARQIMEKTQIDLLWVEREFFNGEPVFSSFDVEKLEEGNDVPSIEDISQETLVQMFAEIIVQAQERIGKLERDNKRLKDQQPTQL